MIKALGISHGIGFGQARVLRFEDKTELEWVTTDPDVEIHRLENAIHIASETLEGIREKTALRMGEEAAQIFEAHLMVLQDPGFVDKIKDMISESNASAEFALDQVSKEFIAIFEAIDDEYLRERGQDIRDISDRLMRVLRGAGEVDLGSLHSDTILVADDLTPSQTAEMNTEFVKGFITVMGGPTSHSAIIARTLEIPAVSGAAGITDLVKDGDWIAIDGTSGEIHINPDSDTLSLMRVKLAQQNSRKESLKKLKGLASISKDGQRVELAANIGGPSDIDGVLRNDAEGVGLFRSEFLYMDRSELPSEEEQFKAYRTVLEKMAGKPVVIRTLDIGGDKNLEYLSLPHEMNPFLGYRAIRICLDRKDIFITQLRALYRASPYGQLKIMFPMIACLEEVRETKALCEDVRAELIREGHALGEKVELGVMIEIPSAAIISDLIAKEVDFMSIGTNDLIQYTVAVDRMNCKIAGLYSAYHPSLLRLINTVIRNGRDAGIWVGMCGESASDPLLIPVLFGMGLYEYSMSAGKVLASRELIRSLDMETASALVAEVLSLSTQEAVKNCLELFRENYERNVAVV